MASRHRVGLASAVGMATMLVILLAPAPKAQANIACAGLSPAAAVADVVGHGNPVGDACNAVTDSVVGAVGGAVVDPLKDAASSIGKGIFNDITSWATDGAVWLLGEVVELTEKTTSPDLISKGFLRQYRQMASIAVVLALAMLIFAALEGLGRGEPGMLWRVFLVNAPVAALGTSAAYVVVQLLLATSDGFSEVITHSTAHDTREFFKSAVAALGEAGGKPGALVDEAGGMGGTLGVSGTVQVPLFVSFIAAILAATAAFMVWIELLMRSAAIYAVALFMPLALAASIWPRWLGALRRSAELIVVLVFSKFVIVAIIALAASLLANTEGEVEHVLSAGALLLLACFSPLVLFKLVPFAEGAVGAAFSRQSAGGGAMQAIHTASSVQMMRRSAQTHWGGAGKGAGGADPSSEGASAKSGTSSAKGATKSGGGGRGVVSGAEVGAAMPVTAGIALTKVAGKAGKAGGERLAETATSKAASESGGSGGSLANGADSTGAKRTSGTDAESRAPRPTSTPPPGGGETSKAGSPGPSPKPTQASGGSAPASETKAPRPAGESAAPAEGAPSSKAKS